MCPGMLKYYYSELYKLVQSFHYFKLLNRVDYLQDLFHGRITVYLIKVIFYNVPIVYI